MVQQQLPWIAPQKSQEIPRQFLQFGYSDTHVLSLESHEQALFWKNDKIQNQEHPVRPLAQPEQQIQLIRHSVPVFLPVLSQQAGKSLFVSLQQFLH